MSAARRFECSGKDSYGRRYRTLRGMWDERLGGEKELPPEQQRWYADAKKYWSNVPPTVDGMLGGLGSLSESDLSASRNFLAEAFGGSGAGGILRYDRALDVGAGIGRVTFGLLAPLFDKVDMLESDARYLEKAKSDAGRRGLSAKLGDQLCMGMEQFCRSPQKYDLIWIQWVVIYLTDADFVRFLTECQMSLRDGGAICIKDNTTKGGFVLDNEDSSITRSDKHMKDIFQSVGLHVVKEADQPNFPSDLFPVRMYALRPAVSVQQARKPPYSTEAIQHRTCCSPSERP
mmetsp:Transcript_7738/g.20479  ORF Transcript_7738/g.20479 Transcript_7738/m.20479 type:complete len:289 (-) Transcript_7738:641-1507(-)|eukprot:CAMPEP_0185835208 /NCGR_PEP_ID=MMETSP1353-20130828/7264_1 /TAXON_ID=1077150 /ORGANISM="Erythrolobus australicus, Strain CCMP3124" /LENGTH=288 /DNA_ID=CAMNT_0028533791 /DNA_START=38 /DNA_END=904 /DNA_ORIENTATION=-